MQQKAGQSPLEVSAISMSVPSPQIGQASYAMISTACSAVKKLWKRVMMGALGWPQQPVPPAAHGCISECEKEGYEFSAGEQDQAPSRGSPETAGQ